MKGKILKKYIYEGLGFPVILKNVPLICIRGEFVPDINFNALQKNILLHLCHKELPLTGYEIRFIRKYFEMTLADFGARFGFSHVAVLKWEKSGNHFAKLESTTDVCIRLFIFSHLCSSKTAFKELYNEINIPKLAKYHKSHHTIKPIAIDMLEDYKMAAGC